MRNRFTARACGIVVGAISVAGMATLHAGQGTAAAAGPLPSPETAAGILAQTPRHGEWMNVKSGVEIVRTYIVHPVRKDLGPCVIVVAEGLDDWARAIGDRLAQEGFTALVADLSTDSPMMGRKPSPPDIGQSLRALKRADLVARMRSVYDYATRLPAVNEKVGIVAFGWGEVPALTYAAAQPGITGTVIFYGKSPAAQDLSAVKSPVLGFYAADDRRSAANIATVQQNWPKAIEFLTQNTK